MPKRLIITIVCFHITAVLLVLGAIAVVTVGLFMSSLFGAMGQAMGGHPAGDMPIGSIFGGFAPASAVFLALMGLAIVACAVVIEFVIRGLNQRAYWAWIVGLVVCGLLIMNGLHSFGIGVALGGLGLWGLVDPDTVAAFKPTAMDSQPPTEN
jgi:hypothetical protein